MTFLGKYSLVSGRGRDRPLDSRPPLWYKFGGLVKKHRTTSVALLGFILAAALFTYPLILHVGTTLRGSDLDALGDPLLNTWTMAWNFQKLSHLDFSGLFDANNFYPQQKTLLYSEHLMSLSLFAFPIRLLSGNPVLAYNLTFLASLVFSAFGMFCLARRLTGSAAGAVAAGLIYAFCPFMTSHHYHIQVVSAWGIPFAFLFLHDFFEDGYRLRPLLLFTLVYVLQCWANGYYALYLTLFGGFWILYQAVLRSSFAVAKFWMRMALFAALAALATAPFYIQYAKVHEDMGFSRGMDFYARLTSYLAAPRNNWIYGRISERFVRTEGELFPGLVALGLGLAGVVLLARLRRVRLRTGAGRGKKIVGVARRILNGTILTVSIVAVFVMGQGGFVLRFFGQQVVQVHNLKRTLIILSVLVVLRILVDVLFGFDRRIPRQTDERHLLGYFGILVLAFLFTFGPTGPYRYLYDYVPGFKAVRVPSRCAIFVMFGLAVLAAFGLRTLFARFRPVLRTALAVLLGAAIVAEYLSIPIKYSVIPIKSQIPEPYRWLAENKKTGVLVELPFPLYDSGTAAVEAARMYFSTYHWLSLVNGYSGYFPPLYTELCRRFEFLPLEQLLDDFRALKVDDILLHIDDYPDDQQDSVKEMFLRLNKEFRLIHQDDYGHYLLEIVPGPVRTPETPKLAGLKRLPRTGWTAKASILNELAPQALDGSAETRWDSGGAQQPGRWFEIDLGTTTEFRAVSLVFGPAGLDFPRGYNVEVSADGKSWKEVARCETTILPIRLFAKPRDLAVNVLFPAERARFIRVTNLGSDRKFCWSIYEAYLYD